MFDGERSRLKKIMQMEGKSARFYSVGLEMMARRLPLLPDSSKCADACLLIELKPVLKIITFLFSSSLRAFPFVKFVLTVRLVALHSKRFIKWKSLVANDQFQLTFIAGVRKT